MPPGSARSAATLIAGSELLERAYEAALLAHHGPAGDGETRIDHPVAVATLLRENQYPEVVVAAALLHDVIEDTEVEASEIESEFGPEVADLVRTMTEDVSICSYPARKAEHRRRVAGDPRAAAIYAADKLAKVRALNADGETPPAEKLDHYRRTHHELREAEPSLPFLADLAEELDRLE
jgi:(p)ppGpp synthase/HD superfamily hydrolase